MGRKSNIRFFRYSDEVAEILEAFKGNTLSEKFENLVLHCFWERQKIEADLDAKRREYERLCKQVEAKKAELMEIGQPSVAMNQPSAAITRIEIDAF